MATWSSIPSFSLIFLVLVKRGGPAKVRPTFAKVKREVLNNPSPREIANGVLTCREVMVKLFEMEEEVDEMGKKEEEKKKVAL